MFFSFGHLTEVDLRATPELLVRDVTLSYLLSWEQTEPTAGGIGGATWPVERGTLTVGLSWAAELTAETLTSVFAGAFGMEPKAALATFRALQVHRALRTSLFVTRSPEILAGRSEAFPPGRRPMHTRGGIGGGPPSAPRAGFLSERLIRQLVRNQGVPI